MHLPLDVWDAGGDNLAEQLAGLDDYAMAVAAYWAAVERRPKDKITLRQGIRVVVKNWSEEKIGSPLTLCGRHMIRSAPTRRSDTTGRDLPQRTVQRRAMTE
jgi:hypothetical protein